jgi:hypothetical protein
MLLVIVCSVANAVGNCLYSVANAVGNCLYSVANAVGKCLYNVANAVGNSNKLVPLQTSQYPENNIAEQICSNINGKYTTFHISACCNINL